MIKKINGGAFQVARRLFNHELWLEKPSSWKVIFIYILGHVNYIDNDSFNRGEGFFMFTKELNDVGYDITIDMIKKCLTYLRNSKVISTERSTRGVKIKVLNYDNYQTLSNYESTERSTGSSTREALEKHYDTKEGKEIKNIARVFCSKDWVAELIGGKSEHVRIIGLYARESGSEFESKAQAEAFLKRWVREASTLTCYSLEQIGNVIHWLKDQDWLSDWTLTTIGKHADKYKDYKVGAGVVGSGGDSRYKTADELRAIHEAKSS